MKYYFYGVYHPVAYFMDYHLLTDHQLKSLYRNRRLNKFMRKGITNEMAARNIDFPVSLSCRRTLPRFYKIVLITCPFLVPVCLSIKALALLRKGRLPVKTSRQLLILILLNGLAVYKVNRFLIAGEERKWRSFWLYSCFGIVLWTIVLIIFARLNFVA